MVCGIYDYKELKKMLARGSGFAGQKDFVFGCRGSGSLIVSIPKTTSSAILRGFDLQIRDWKPIFTII